MIIIIEKIYHYFWQWFDIALQKLVSYNYLYYLAFTAEVPIETCPYTVYEPNAMCVHNLTKKKIVTCTFLLLVHS